MAAGTVSAPLIIPIIHLESHGAKSHIDTRTPVSIQADSAGALIFFTLDGSKPGAMPGRSLGSSRKYSKPIFLPAGRVSVRALAISRDGRQSSVVTKFFNVDLVEDQEAEQSLMDRSSSSCHNAAEPRMMGRGPPPSGFLRGQLDSGSSGSTWTRSSRRPQSAGAGEQLNRTQESRVQRETDFLRCFYPNRNLRCPRCLSPRPSDPFSGFCAQCGAAVPPVPGQRLPPAEAGQTVRCVFCNAYIPINSERCLICEESIRRPLRPHTSIAVEDHQVCVCCGTGNPAHLCTCLTCESRLQPPSPVVASSKVGCSGNSAPSVPAADSSMLTCSRCKRLNHSDARFCDWCGSKPAHAASCVTCWRCGASGHPYALYCPACGVFLEAPAPPTSDTHLFGGATTSRAPTSHDALLSSGPAPTLKVTPPTMDQYTQTVGLFYPSATGLKKKEQQRALEASRQMASRDRRPLLTSISPGRGYWRKQLDHVCAHLRSYAQNNAPFRALLGEPRLGRMVSAVVQEDQHEVSLTISFVTAEWGQQQVGPQGDLGGSGPASRTETLSSITERSVKSSLVRTIWGSDGTTLESKGSDAQLLKEVGPGGGRVSIMQQLLDQGHMAVQL